MKKWKMRAHQQRIVQSIYRAASEPSSWLSKDYRTWKDGVRFRRGALDRKKKVTPKALQVALGFPGESVDLERFIYAVERYVAMRALHTIEACLDIPLAQVLEVPEPVMQGLAFRDEIRLVLSNSCPLDLEQDDLELLQLVAQSIDGNLEDKFQAEFMALVPRQVRHAIGSFYTPQWLARHIVRNLGFRHEDATALRGTVCDPACGSGVFLVAAAEEIRQAAQSGNLSSHTAVDLVLTGLHGIDVELVPCLLATASLSIAAKSISAIAGKPLERIPATIRNQDTLDERSRTTTRFDYVVGNPPWINWEYMPREYREKHAQLWLDLSIFDSRGKTMSFSKEDISALFVAHAIYYRSKEHGKFSFVLPESLFKSTLNHQGFRAFELGFERSPYRIAQLEDFVDVKPFEGVANRTVVVYGENSLPTEYPLSFVKWSKFTRKDQAKTGGSGLTGTGLDGLAQLADANSPGSSWSTGASGAISVHRQLDGRNAYRARTGLFTGGANAVFHLRPIAPLDDGMLRVANVTERAKRPVPQIQVSLEDTYIYPFLRGRDVTQWRSDVELATLLPHTAETRMAPVPETTLENTAPATLEYFKNFKSILDERRGFSAWEAGYRETGYYACQRVGDYTFADWKVVWRYISTKFTTAVLGPLAFAGMDVKPVIPNEKLMLVACESPDEAYYLGGVLSASVVVEHVHSRMVSTQISPSIVSGIGIPLFDATDLRHLEIARICEIGHAARRGGAPVTSEQIQILDQLVAEIWGLTHQHADEARQRNPF